MTTVEQIQPSTQHGHCQLCGIRLPVTPSTGTVARHPVHTSHRLDSEAFYVGDVGLDDCPGSNNLPIEASDDLLRPRIVQAWAEADELKRKLDAVSDYGSWLRLRRDMWQPKGIVGSTR